MNAEREKVKGIAFFRGIGTQLCPYGLQPFKKEKVNFCLLPFALLNIYTRCYLLQHNFRTFRLILRSKKLGLCIQVISLCFSDL